MSTFVQRLHDIVLIDLQDAPDTNPFIHKYTARDLYQSLYDELSEPSKPEEDPIHTLNLLTIRSRLAINYFNTEETSEASRRLESLLPEFLSHLHGREDLEIDCYISEYFEAVNSLAVIKANRSEFEEASTILTSCLEFATSLNLVPSLELIESGKSNPNPNPNTNAFPGTSPACEHLTQSLYLLAQVRTSLHDKVSAANLLKAVLARKQGSISEEERITWSNHMIDLAQFFIDNNDLNDAEQLLIQSREILSNLDGETVLETESTINSHLGRLELARLVDLCEDKQSNKHVDISLVDRLYRSALEYFHDALSFFVLDGYVTDHITLLKCTSQAHRCMALCCDDREHALRYHEKRLPLLESIIPTLNPQPYSDIIRVMRLDVADVYYFLLEGKRALATDIKEIHKKCVSLARTALRHCLYVRISCIRDGSRRDDVLSIVDKDFGLVFDPLKEYKRPEEYGKVVRSSIEYIGDDFLDTYLSATFLSAKLWTTIPALDPMQESAYAVRGMMYYDQVCEILSVHPARSHFENELEIASKMRDLLKMKVGIN
ncbi:hypothetical protein P9112_013543 [Eukaryota sp. TZLM1-RC]